MYNLKKLYEFSKMNILKDIYVCVMMCLFIYSEYIVYWFI